MKIYYKQEIYDDNELEQIECVEDTYGNVVERYVIKNLNNSPVFTNSDEVSLKDLSHRRIDGVMHEMCAYIKYLEKRIEKLENKDK